MDTGKERFNFNVFQDKLAEIALLRQTLMALDTSFTAEMNEYMFFTQTDGNCSNRDEVNMFANSLDTLKAFISSAQKSAEFIEQTIITNRCEEVLYEFN